MSTFHGVMGLFWCIAMLFNGWRGLTCKDDREQKRIHVWFWLSIALAHVHFAQMRISQVTEQVRALERAQEGK